MKQNIVPLGSGYTNRNDQNSNNNNLKKNNPTRRGWDNEEVKLLLKIAANLKQQQTQNISGGPIFTSFWDEVSKQKNKIDGIGRDSKQCSSKHRTIEKKNLEEQKNQIQLLNLPTTNSQNSIAHSNQNSVRSERPPETFKNYYYEGEERKIGSEKDKFINERDLKKQNSNKKQKITETEGINTKDLVVFFDDGNSKNSNQETSTNDLKKILEDKNIADFIAIFNDDDTHSNQKNNQYEEENNINPFEYS